MDVGGKIFTTYFIPLAVEMGIPRKNVLNLLVSGEFKRQGRNSGKTQVGVRINCLELCILKYYNTRTSQIYLKMFK